MKGKWIPWGSMIALTLLALAAGLTHAQGGGPGNGVGPQGGMDPYSAFTYQGMLKRNGAPVNGLCDFRLRLYGPNNVLLGEEYPSAQVTNGLFTLYVQTFAQYFTGEARWLEIAVKCPGDSGYVDVGTQPLLPVPYAMALPGMRASYDPISPNVIGGYSGNSVRAGVVGATIGGGGVVTAVQRIEANYATIGGGQGNFISGAGATIGGGGMNIASGDASTIGGGYANQARAAFATIGGGGPTDMNNPSATSNRVTDEYGTVGGGGGNQAGSNDGNPTNATFATVGGGGYNAASGYAATVGGGIGNNASQSYATVGGGVGNAAGNSATVGGGAGNTASGAYATVGGGESNLITATYATIAGGYNITVTGPYAAVGGGYQNEASGPSATIGGGWTNTASGNASTVGGGDANKATGAYTTIAGGRFNTASDYFATVGGGGGNTASGDFATVPGGIYNLAQGDFSFAAGRRAKANNQGCFVWGDSTDADVTCNNDDRWVARASGGVYFYTNSGLTSGVYVAAGGSSWNAVSSRALKENFAPVDTRQLLERLAAIEITTWNYKSQDPSIRHIGPMAEDFNTLVDGLGGEGKEYINSLDADGVALAAIQGLYGLVQEKDARIAELEKRVAALEAQNAAQQAQIEALEARLAALEQRLGATSAPASALPASGLALSGLALAGAVVYRRRKGGGR